MSARLIVNADDFGFTRGVNEGIVACHREGILTATTLMANGAAFDHAVELAQRNPTLDVGCHLVLVQGPGLPATVPELLWALARRRIDPYTEFARQVRKIVAKGIRPTHLDTHKHTHLAPPVLDAVIRISREFGIPWVRKPADFPAGNERLVTRAVRAVANRFDRRLREGGCRSTDHFTGFQLTGGLTVETLVSIIRALPEGLTELMCHPGFVTDDLRGTRLRESREAEYRALTSPEARGAIQERGAKLTNYQVGQA